MTTGSIRGAFGRSPSEQRRANSAVAWRRTLSQNQKKPTAQSPKSINPCEFPWLTHDMEALCQHKVTAGLSAKSVLLQPLNPKPLHPTLNPKP